VLIVKKCLICLLGQLFACDLIIKLHGLDFDIVDWILTHGGRTYSHKVLDLLLTPPVCVVFILWSLSLVDFLELFLVFYVMKFQIFYEIA